MTTLIPTSQPTGVEAYEDMFKEITRKLYGEESAHGLYPHNTQVAQVAQLASGAPAAPEGGERSFTTLVSDRSLTQIDYETTTVNDQQQQQQQQGQHAQSQQQPIGGFKTEDHLTTAFGLAALMQNGFPPPGAILNPVNFPVNTVKPPSTSEFDINISTLNTDDRWQQTQQVPPQEPPADQSWNSGKHSSSSYSQKSFKKPKVEPQDSSPPANGGSTLNIPQAGTDKKGNFGTASATVGAATGKRYSCTSCPYTTDRRDLFTRHENIHKEEKPFHCYACLKQFNRADHVKKHFLRMHRDMEYEIAKTRRIVNSKSYYNGNNGNSVPVSAPTPQPTISQPQTIQANTLNIPTASFPAQITIPTHHVTVEHTANISANNHDISTMNGAVHHVQIQNQQQPQQQQQQHQQQQQQQPLQQPQQTTQIILAPPIVAIKQEKGSAIVSNNNNNNNGSNSTTVDEKPFAKKIKGEKRFTCCYCPWSGADNWGLKRHLNTHTKPFVCMLCDYKAARSERLATHVFKVHNKKACNKCNFFAEDQAQLNAHQLEAHLLNMQAIGRNKASVTQDFHNAGGGNHNVSNSSSRSSSSSNSTNRLSLLVAASSSASCSPLSSPPWCSPAHTPTAAATDCSTNHHPQQYAKSPTNSNVGSTLLPSPPPVSSLTEEHLSLLQLLATAAVAQQHLQQKATSMTTITSPPASHPQQQQQPNHHHHHYHHQNSTNSQNSTGETGSKRRRKSSSRKDKENQDHRHPQSVTPGATSHKVIDLTTASGGANIVGSPAENGIERNNNSSNNNNSSVNNKNINETIFDRVYKKPYNMYLASAFCKPIIEKEGSDGKENFSLAEFLRNHKEVSISTLAANNKPEDGEDVVFVHEEIGRVSSKQQLIRTADTDSNPLPVPTMCHVTANTEINQIGDIRDKHMIRLISRRLCCRICQNQQRLEHVDNCHYHSKTSLILHNRWRHGTSTNPQQRCKLCGSQFGHRYKLILHQRLKHRRSQGKRRSAKKPPPPVLAAKKCTKLVSKKSQRKQKKRKPKSWSYSKKRK
ncbi:uncharacterized protein LOC131693092 isoform X3 [Topomyia yanbarensis]|uniref:uncharacterized protein LOC131693092 isoform X3 n=1 Tax=Topomyia yanbarensis TaxID=2498891 RepID=UPI00273C45A4|nr:uncharacterized protein LOC131693092 isoform X3 [Topomyia yanbarensis]